MTNEEIEIILDQCFDDAEKSTKKILKELDVKYSSITATGIISFLKGRIPGALLNPERYNYKTTRNEN